MNMTHGQIRNTDEGDHQMSSSLIDAEELARRLNVPKSWVYASARSGRIPSSKLGKYRRFDYEAVREAIQNHEDQGGIRQ